MFSVCQRSFTYRKIQSSFLYHTNAVIQKHTAATNERGVIIHFSFLLFDTKFMTVFNERYTAITMQIILDSFMLTRKLKFSFASHANTFFSLSETPPHHKYNEIKQIYCIHYHVWFHSSRIPIRIKSIYICKQIA